MKLPDVICALYTRYRQLFWYCVIGCSGAALDFVVFYLLVNFASYHHQLANFISISCGIVNNFMLNYFFNFKSGNRIWLRLLSFYAVGMVGWALSAAMLYILVDKLALLPVVAKLLTIFVVTIVQYVLNKSLSFRKVKHD